jgi:hypothetical protein
MSHEHKPPPRNIPHPQPVLNVLKILPPEIHPLITKSLLAQVIAEWEDINREVDRQLQNNE